MKPIAGKTAGKIVKIAIIMIRKKSKKWRNKNQQENKLRKTSRAKKLWEKNPKAQKNEELEKISKKKHLKSENAGENFNPPPSHLDYYKEQDLRSKINKTLKKFISHILHKIN